MFFECCTQISGCQHCSNMKFVLKDFFIKGDQIGRKQRVWSQLRVWSHVCVCMYVVCIYVCMDDNNNNNNNKNNNTNFST